MEPAVMDKEYVCLPLWLQTPPAVFRATPGNDQRAWSHPSCANNVRGRIALNGDQNRDLVALCRSNRGRWSRHVLAASAVPERKHQILQLASPGGGLLETIA